MINKLKELFLHHKHKLQGKIPDGHKRSSSWPKVRKEHLSEHPTCALCGGKESLEVHHIHPFHLKPELELDITNLITLCEAKKDGVNCHLLFGHLGNFKSFNFNVKPDSEDWNKKIKERPL